MSFRKIFHIVYEYNKKFLSLMKLCNKLGFVTQINYLKNNHVISSDYYFLLIEIIFSNNFSNNDYFLFITEI